MKFSRLKAISKKEFKHLLRDTRLLALIILFPVFLLAIFGYAVNFDVKHLKYSVLDNDHSTLSHDFQKSLLSSEYFEFVNSLKSESDIKPELDNRRAKTVIVIPKNFERDFYEKRDVKIQFLIDGIDANTANVARSYFESATSSFNQLKTKIQIAQVGTKQYTPIDVTPSFWYNPDLQTTRFLIPGLISMILVVTAVISVSLSLVREKERGTSEQLNVSPVQTFELLIGKLLPYFILALINAAFILLIGNILFDVTVKGSMLDLFVTTMLFLFASASIGIFVSAVSESQQVAFTLATFLSLLPSVILSGFIFQIESMPRFLQVITNITPAKFYTVILRSIILRGTSFATFWREIVYLVIYTIVVLALATVITKKKERSA